MPLKPLHNEKDLLRQVAEDDHQAFGSIFDHYWDKIYSMALSYTKSVPQAEDLVQEVFIRIWNDRARLPGILQFDSYLFIVARNAIIGALRKQFAIVVPLHGDPEDAWSSGDPLPDQLYAVKESQALINLAVEGLPPQQRRVYRLSREEGLSQLEIARELGISVHTVKGHMSQALLHIRNYLSDNNNRSHILWGLILTAILGK